MKKRVITVASVVFLLLVTLCFCASAADGTSAQDALDLAEDKREEVTFTQDKDTVYYKFVPKKTTYYEFAIYDDLSSDFYMSIYDADGNYLVDTAHNQITGETYGVEMLTASQTYYLRVRGYVGEDAEKTVSISIFKHAHTLKNENLYKAEVTKISAYNGSYNKDCTRCDYSKQIIISAAKTIKLSATEYVYNGKTKKPTITVKSSAGKALKNGTDYKITGTTSSKKIGSYKIKITFKGNYTGSRTLTWQIIPPAPKNLKATQTTRTITLTWSKVSGAKKYVVYDDWGDKIATVKTNKAVIKDLYSGKKYSFTVKAIVVANSKNIYGKAAAIKTSTKTDAPSYVEAKGKTGKAVISWFEDYGVNGYQVQMATSKNGKYKTVATVKSREEFTERSTTISKLNKGTYYFKVRSYVKNGSNTVYGTWSTAVSAKVK